MYECDISVLVLYYLIESKGGKDINDLNIGVSGGVACESS